MVLIDIFKKKQKGKELKKEKIEKVEKKEPIVEVKPQQSKTDQAYRILKNPHVTEKATLLAKERNQYVFKVWPGANKIEVKKAIEDLYGVDVLAVRVINIPAKKRRVGRISGWRKGYKKAIVKIKEGQKIEVLPH